MCTLAKLVQTGSVADYHDTFEKYLNRVEGLSDYALIPIFIEGLKQPIQEKVELQHPQSLAEAMAIALRLGATQENTFQQAASGSKKNWTHRESRQSALPAPGPSATARPPSSTSTKITPILVSNAEKSERSWKGLCWHCPEKYVSGHVCAVKLLCYVGDEDVNEEVGHLDVHQQVDEVITADISHLHSLNGNSRLDLFR